MRNSIWSDPLSRPEARGIRDTSRCTLRHVAPPGLRLTDPFLLAMSGHLAFGVLVANRRLGEEARGSPLRDAGATPLLGRLFTLCVLHGLGLAFSALRPGLQAGARGSLRWVTRQSEAGLRLLMLNFAPGPVDLEALLGLPATVLLSSTKEATPRLLPEQAAVILAPSAVPAFLSEATSR